MGTNLAGIADWSSQLPFIDAFSSARKWITQGPSAWDTGEASLLDLDANGWVKSLPAPADAPAYTHVVSLLLNSLQGHYPGGRYVVLYDGEGTLEYGFDARKNLAASQAGRDVLDVTPSDSGIYLKIALSDPNQNGNYIRNIRVVPEAYENNYSTQIFNPDFLNKIDPFHTLRFMDWMVANNSQQGQWSERPNEGAATWANYDGVPVEIMVALANRTHSNPWFTLPHQATDEYVSNFARYVKEHLDPQLQVYVEYSNEIWNSVFTQGNWIEAQALQEWPSIAESPFTLRIDWFSKRTTQITQIWDQVFGADKERVIGVMGGFSANPWVSERALSYAWTDTPKTNQEYGIDGVAIAPYFGYYLGDPSVAASVESWTHEPDGGVSKLFDELTQGGLLSNSPPGGALDAAYESIQANAQIAQRENVQLLAYEGGQHLAGFYGVENSIPITNLFMQANRDPRMGEIYQQYLSKWFELGGGTFVNFSDISRFSKWGSWGALEYVDQPGSPKYDALLDLIHAAATTASI